MTFNQWLATVSPGLVLSAPQWAEMGWNAHRIHGTSLDLPVIEAEIIVLLLEDKNDLDS